MRIIFTATILMTAFGAMAQSRFEGVITMNTTNAAMKETATVTWYLKDGRSRLDFNSQAGDTHSEYAVITDEKGMDLVAQGHVTPVPAVAMKMESAKQQFVSETKGLKVNGFDCSKQVYTDGTNETTYWLTDALDIRYSDLPFFIRKNMPQISSDAFPVKMEKRDSTGKVVLSQDVLSITPQTVDDSSFERK